MKRIILTLIMVFSILCQPCYAADKKTDFSQVKKPDWELVSHDICIYTLAPDEFFLYKEYYPLLDGETRKVVADTNIDIHLSNENVRDKLKELEIKIYSDEFEYYQFDSEMIDDEIIVPDLNSNMFAGNVTLSLELLYNDDSTEIHKFNFEKEDSFTDIVLKEDPRVVKSGVKDVVVSCEIENFSKLLYPEKISVKSITGNECALGGEKKSYNVYNDIVIPFETDGFERNYTVTIPAGTIMLETGLNNELTFEVHSDIEYVVPENFLISTSPAENHIKYISGEQEDITITIKIKEGFKVDDSKPIYFNREEVKYSTEVTDSGTTLTFTANAKVSKKHNVEFGEGLIIGANGEKVGQKHNYNFSVVDINTMDVPEKVIFTDLPVDHWAFDYITQLALDDIISGYEDKTFKPNGNVTRAELTKMLAASFKLEGTTKYSDVNNHWADTYISSVGEFVPVTDNQFRPNDEATRQDVAVALVNILDKTERMKLQETKLTFDDIPMIDEEYVSHIGKAVSGGIISGYGDGTFRPQEPITRAEVATMICRIIR